MGLSLSVAVLMLVGKLGAYWLTGSAAILSDAAESVVHIVATGIATASLWFARQEACEKHPYGHGKVAYFSAGFEGALILTAAIFIFFSSTRALIEGPELRELSTGLVITFVLATVNLALGLFLVHVGKRTNSLVLVANGKHVLTDMWTSYGVVAGVAIVWLTGYTWLDPVVAIVMGLNITWTSIRLIYRSFGGLIDAADPSKTEALLACLDRAQSEGHMQGYHQLRHRQSDNTMWVEVHLLLPEDMEVKRAHRSATAVEDLIRAAFPGFHVFVTTHLEPSGHASAHPDGHPGIEDPYNGVAQH
ncbi:MAG: cation transporter [bacterium]|nr:cation transporter [bacterium]